MQFYHACKANKTLQVYLYLFALLASISWIMRL